MAAQRTRHDVDTPRRVELHSLWEEATRRWSRRNWLVVPNTSDGLRSFSWRSAGRWLFGSAFSMLIWLMVGLHQITLRNSHDVLQIMALAPAMVLYLVVPPLSWGRSELRKVWLWTLMMVFAVPAMYFTGATGIWLACFFNVATGMQMHRRLYGLVLILLIEMMGVLSSLSHGIKFSDFFSGVAVSGSLGLMIIAFSRQIESVRVLRRTQQELAVVAVAAERNRVARDMHDILGHSLTVISVKAELAAKLMSADPQRAGKEIADVQDLARGALADVRATVGGYRGVNILTELANAKAALDAAEITAELPTVADAVPAKYRELFGWALRESVTNIIKHSGAGRVMVQMGRDFIQIADDGVGPTGAVSQGTDDSASEQHGNGPGGNGLAGLAERVDEAGGSLRIGRSELGGFLVKVSV